MILDKFRLDNKVAIVTGAGKGIGACTALSLAEVGAQVVCVARTQTDVDAQGKKHQQTRGQCHHAESCWPSHQTTQITEECHWQKQGESDRFWTSEAKELLEADACKGCKERANRECP